jgi:hypothetical protein
MNRATDNVAASSQDTQKQMQAKPTAAQEAQGAKTAARDPNKLERLGRYEVHLDRKLERMLCCCGSRDDQIILSINGIRTRK